MESNLKKDLGSVLSEIKPELLSYTNRRLKWAKLIFHDRSAKLISAFMYGLLVTVTIFILLFFSLIGLALYIGHLLNDPLFGFAVMAGLALVILIVMVLMRKKLRDYFLNNALIFMRKMENDDEMSFEDDDEETTDEA